MTKQICNTAEWAGRLWKSCIDVDAKEDEPDLSPEGNRIGDTRTIKYEYDALGNIVDADYKVEWDGYCWHKKEDE